MANAKVFPTCFCSVSDSLYGNTSLNIDEHLVMSYYADEVTEQEKYLNKISLVIAPPVR